MALPPMNTLALDTPFPQEHNQASFAALIGPEGVGTGVTEHFTTGLSLAPGVRTNPVVTPSPPVQEPVPMQATNWLPLLVAGVVVYFIFS